MPIPARILLLAVALGAACSMGLVHAAEQRMSREAYAAAKDAMAERHSKALAHCKTVDGGAQSRCRMQADGRRKIDLASLELRWHPSANNSFKASMAEVDLAYALAMDQCKKQHTGSDKESKAALKSCSDKAKGNRVAGEQAAHQQASHMVKQIGLRMAGKPLRPYRYRDFGSLVSLGEFSTVGNMMGGLIGGSLMVEGLFARTMYLSLYKMHELALHGFPKVALDTLARLIVRRTEPHVKLH